MVHCGMGGYAMELAFMKSCKVPSRWYDIRSAHAKDFDEGSNEKSMKKRFYVHCLTVVVVAKPKQKSGPSCVMQIVVNLQGEIFAVIPFRKTRENTMMHSVNGGGKGH